MAKPIYVEITMRVSLDRLWHFTQQPDEHERWDLRFSEIDYLPRPDAAEPQRFRYATRIGFGLTVEGTGESVGEHDASGERSSALRFGSDDPKSLIRDGSGYWKYVPTERGVRFLTLYDYQTRFGPLGRAIDAMFFRPLIGWATAWSFDRLRLWLERGIDPQLSATRAVIDALVRASLAMCWVYQGLVPKIIAHDEQEYEAAAAVLPVSLQASAQTVVMAVGVVEIIVGLLHPLTLGRRWVFGVGIGLLVAVTAPALATSPSMFTHAFNPASLVIAMIGLSGCGLIACRDLPSARRCLRIKPGNNQ